jgi:abhydrolase domain-containing protein 6
MKFALSLRDEFIRNIPTRWKENFGEEFYAQYLKMHLKLMKGRVEQFGEERKIEYMVTQQGHGEKMIFLPGFADVKENFYNAAQFLVKDCDLLVPDLPGFGRSFKRKGDTYKLSNYSRWMHDFIEQTGWDQFHLVGNSLGGAVAAELALSMPERIKSLSLVDCAAIVLQDQPSIYQEFLDGRNVFAIATHLQFEYFLNRVCHTPPVIPPFVKEHIYRDFHKHTKWHKKVLSDLLEGIQTLKDPQVETMALNSRLKDIKVPTMIVWGDEDTFFPPATANFVHSQIPGSVLYLLADRGHAPHIEAPYQFAQLVRKFMRRHS